MRRSGSLGQSRRAGEPLVIGLVNNMPDAALRATERQFGDLLRVAARSHSVRLRIFSMPAVPRGESGHAHVAQHYEDIDRLWTSRIDGLIVTGTEPQASSLKDEPYWPTFTRLVDWAEDNTISTIWSCLAAHGAVLYMDGVSRRPLASKLSGVFKCEKVGDHEIVAGAPAAWYVPHSRLNELAEESLTSRGYAMLSSSREAGVDMFLKRRESLFLFLQGHPEYDAGALLREYRRDVGRFLNGEREGYPEMPHGCCDAEAAEAFAAFRDVALQQRRADLLGNFPAHVAEKSMSHSWRDASVRLYRNWLSYLHERGVRPRAAGDAGKQHDLAVEYH